MSQRLPATPAPGLLEPYAASFDSLFSKLNQRTVFRLYLTGLLLPAERNKTLTGLANTEPIVGAQHPRAQQLQWFLSESTWDAQAVNTRRLELLRSDARTAPTEAGVLVIDETGDRKAGTKTAHVGRQYLANLGKIDNGVVSVSSLWADERLYYPLEVEPYTPAHHFERGQADPAFRTKPEIALELVQHAVTAGIPFRAVVADCFYGENEAFRSGLHALGVGYVLALKPSHAWWHPADEIGSLWEAAHAAAWDEPEHPGEWVAIERKFRDGHTEIWWALEVDVGPYSTNKTVRAVIVTTDPMQLPDLTTWYLLSNLPPPVVIARRRARSRPPAWRRRCGCMGCGCGWSKAISRSKARWAGPNIRCAVIRQFTGTGRWCAVPLRSAGGTRAPGPSQVPAVHWLPRHN
jgi:DDE superfamily endonuclease